MTKEHTCPQHVNHASQGHERVVGLSTSIKKLTKRIEGKRGRGQEGRGEERGDEGIPRNQTAGHIVWQHHEGIALLRVRHIHTSTTEALLEVLHLYSLLVV